MLKKYLQAHVLVAGINWKPRSHSSHFAAPLNAHPNIVQFIAHAARHGYQAKVNRKAPLTWNSRG